MASKKPKTVKPKAFIVYMDHDDHKRLQKFALANKLAMTQVMREALDMRLAKDAQYITGFNDGLKSALEQIKKTPVAQITFPNQKTLAQVVEDALNTAIKRQA